MGLGFFGEDDDIIQIYQAKFLHISRQNYFHSTLKSFWGIIEPKCHSVKPIIAIIARKPGFVVIRPLQIDLQIPLVTLVGEHIFRVSETIYTLFHPWKLVRVPYSH